MSLLDLESILWGQGYKSIACIDECGRGPLFGWVVSAAVIMPEGLMIDGVNDSKQVSPRKREQLFDKIKNEAIAVGIGMADVQIIEDINIKQAARLSMKMAIEDLNDKDGNPVKPDFLLIDAEKVDIDIPQQGIIKGDALCHGIAAASIIAKVTRDHLCEKWAEELNLPGEYRDVLIQSKGYGTEKHMECIARYGYTKLHRKSFLGKINPLREYTY